MRLLLALLGLLQIFDPWATESGSRLNLVLGCAWNECSQAVQVREDLEISPWGT